MPTRIFKALTFASGYFVSFIRCLNVYLVFSICLNYCLSGWVYMSGGDLVLHPALTASIRTYIPFSSLPSQLTHGKKNEKHTTFDGRSETLHLHKSCEITD